MGETKKMLFARNLICVCIDSNENADYQGEVWHQYSDDPVHFDGANSMMVIMDNLYDLWDFPQRSLERREFNSNKNRSEYGEKTEKLVIDQVQAKYGTRNIQNKRGQLGTFIVQVAFRQNASWQGHVVHAESNEKLDFESAMGLINIIDSKISKEG